MGRYTSLTAQARGHLSECFTGAVASEENGGVKEVVLVLLQDAVRTDLAARG